VKAERVDTQHAASSHAKVHAFMASPFQPYPRLIAARELDAGGLESGRVCLSLIQSGASLGEKRTTLAGEPEGRPGATLHWLDITAREKPLQVATFIARKRGRVVLFDFTKQFDLRIRQLIGHFVASGAGLPRREYLAEPISPAPSQVDGGLPRGATAWDRTEEMFLLLRGNSLPD
jgi:hypothetical protein